NFKKILSHSHSFAWQRPTLAERKSATIALRTLLYFEASVRIFLPFLKLLALLALLNSLLNFLNSSASNAFSS
ncbi:hypothetical protein, partial [Staphylococcus borealis]|uniref:hypothetical protein n=1 Tax=Staphylococcus borealis TaxID=2742203 RepID=UPI00374E97CC